MSPNIAQWSNSIRDWCVWLGVLPVGLLIRTCRCCSGDTVRHIHLYRIMSTVVNSTSYWLSTKAPCSNFPGPVEDYQLPFEDEVGQHPNLENMQEVVVQRKLRPPCREQWRNHPVRNMGLSGSISIFITIPGFDVQLHYNSCTYSPCKYAYKYLLFKESLHILMGAQCSTYILWHQ